MSEPHLTKPMLKPRKARFINGKGEAWFYVSPHGIEVCVAENKDAAASHQVLITRRQLVRALEIMDAP